LEVGSLLRPIRCMASIRESGFTGGFSTITGDDVSTVSAGNGPTRRRLVGVLE
jgi:hypothetical protein